MRLHFLLFLLVYSIFSLQAQFKVTDDFEDGDLLVNPKWQGDEGLFTNIGGVLTSNNSQTNDTFYLANSLSKSSEMEWSVDLKLNISTSSKNYIDLILLSNISNFNDTFRGYFIRVGGTKDNFTLYRSDGSSNLVSLATSTPSITHSFEGSIAVSRDSLASWAVSYQPKGASSIKAFEIQDVNYFSDGFTGLSVRQSSVSFHKKHEFDNFYGGSKIVDTKAPFIDSSRVYNPQKVQLYFNEDIDTLLDVSQFELLRDNSNPSNISIISKNQILLSFPTLKSDLVEFIKVKAIKDTLGNALADTIIKVLYSSPSVYKQFDVLITEIMIDPEPTVDLPAVEYVEFWNATKKVVELEGFIFSDASKSVSLPAYSLMPDSFVILCKEEHIPLFDTPNKIGVSSFPTLNNTSDSLKLQTSDGLQLDAVFYTDSWHSSSWKNAGGWSLERKDLKKPCLQISNWGYSTNPIGGTPGLQNSINTNIADNEAPKLVQAIIQNDNEVKLSFDSWITAYSALETDFILENTITPVFLSKHPYNEIVIEFSDDFEEGKLYHLSLINIADCQNNLSDTIKTFLAIPVPSSRGDILINEVLFNPKVDEMDWIEIYNNSDKVIDLKDLRTAHKNENNDFESLSIITESSYPIFPHTFVVITKDKAAILKRWPKAVKNQILEVSSLPSLPNDEGNIALVNKNGQEIDFINYVEEMHSKWISNTDGVSLERLYYSQSSLKQDNWASASASSNYGTPTSQNSQSKSNLIENTTFTISPDPFSPNGDGYNDLAVISFKSSTSALVQIRIFDKSGRLVRHLVNNKLAGSDNTFIWDGANDNGVKVPTDTYILYLEIVDLSGKTYREKTVITLVK